MATSSTLRLPLSAWQSNDNLVTMATMKYSGYYANHGDCWLPPVKAWKCIPKLQSCLQFSVYNAYFESWEKVAEVLKKFLYCSLSIVFYLLSHLFNRVDDEKDARGHLQALASKMVEELEYLKHSPNSSFANSTPSHTNVRIHFYYALLSILVL